MMYENAVRFVEISSGNCSGWVCMIDAEWHLQNGRWMILWLSNAGEGRIWDEADRRCLRAG